MTELSSTTNGLVEIWPVIVDKEVQSAQVIYTLQIPATIDYFNGHFPNAPILAGVVQLHWAVEYAKQSFDLAQSDVQNLEVLKFQVVIIPGQELTLTLNKKSNSKIAFSYQSAKGQHASGRIVFEANS